MLQSWAQHNKVADLNLLPHKRENLHSGASITASALSFQPGVFIAASTENT